MPRPIKLEDLEKVESSSVIPLAKLDADVVQGIIKVNVEDYVPKGVQVRAAISPLIFTAEFKPADLEALESDEKVVSVAINKPLRSSK